MTLVWPCCSVFKCSIHPPTSLHEGRQHAEGGRFWEQTYAETLLSHIWSQRCQSKLRKAGAADSGSHVKL